MSLFTRKKICITHNGTFHADDLFATAVLYILNKGNIKIIRTRDKELIKKGDYVYDVGGIYNEEKDNFDHHQKEGGGSRENGIPYASFGLVWKKYGAIICGNIEVANIIDEKIAQPIDAIDNGVDISKPIYDGIFPYNASNIFLNNSPTWKENSLNIDIIFKNEVKKIAQILQREIEVTKANVEAKNILLNDYLNSIDKKIIITNYDFPRYLFQKILSKLEEPIYLVYPSGHSTMWKVEAISKGPFTMESRKPFPESWRGYFNGDPKLKENTGVEDADFCHKGGFLITALSKEGAIRLAEKALLA